MRKGGGKLWFMDSSRRDPESSTIEVLTQVKAALASGIFDAVVVSSENAEIRAVAEKAGAVAFERDPATASDTASSEAGVLDYIDRTPRCETLALVQCTSPLTSAEDFANGWALFVKAGADSLVTVVRAHKFLWRVDAETGCATPQNYEPKKRPRRQEWDGEMIENGAFYFFKVAVFRANGNSRLAGKMVAHEMPEETLVEIDSLTDWKIVELLAADKFKKDPGAWGF